MGAALDVKADLSEKLNYNALWFPFRILESWLSDFDRFAAECHWHRDFEFLWTEEGSICYFVNGQHVRLNPGEGIFVNSGRLHYGYSPERAECRCRFVVADPSVLMQNAHVAARILSMEKGQDYLVLHPQGILLSERDQQTVKEMVAFIHSHMGEKISLEEIASSGAVCQSKCCQLFRTYIGQSPGKYLQRVRIARSVELLKREEKSITDIALECGFGSSSYYVATFRQVTGTTPLAFRKYSA